MDTKKSKKIKDWVENQSEKPTRNYSFKSASDQEVDLAYFPNSIDNEYSKDLGFPGEYPYTRSIHPNLYRGKLWTMRQFAGFGSPSETNKRFKYLIVLKIICFGLRIKKNGLENK